MPVQLRDIARSTDHFDITGSGPLRRRVGGGRFPPDPVQQIGRLEQPPTYIFRGSR